MALSSERSHHCPFLNRTDSRCGTHFHLDQLDHAFEYCFDRYTACSTYLERLVERRLRQDEQSQPERESSQRQSLVQVTIHATARRVVHETAEQPVSVALGQTIAGPRINAHSILRGFDRFARRTVFRATSDLAARSGDAASRAA